MQVTCQEITSDEDKEVCLGIRHAVFVEEQKVPPTLEVDGMDGASRHFAVKANDKIVATCRVRMIGSAAKIERVAVLKDYRRMGIGQTLMKYVLHMLPKQGDIQLLKLSSQADAVPFYEKLGFKTRGNEYLDAGMPHYDMIREI